MNNLFLRPFYKNLQLQIAQTIFADNRVYHIGYLSLTDTTCSMGLGLISMCKNFSLPVSVFNQNIEVSQHCKESQSNVQTYSKPDILISFLNLSSMNHEERYKLIRKMQEHAPKALFVDFENPERNIAYPMYYSLIWGEYISFYGQKSYEALSKRFKKGDKYIQKKNAPIEHLKGYLDNGALEGFIYDIPNQTGVKPKIIKQKHLYVGGIGLFYCEW